MNRDDDNPIFPDLTKRRDEGGEDRGSLGEPFELDFDQPPPKPDPGVEETSFTDQGSSFDEPGTEPSGAPVPDEFDVEAPEDEPVAPPVELPPRRPGRVLAFGLAVAVGTTALTGMGLSFHYAPDADLAHASLQALQQDEPLGALLRTLHWFGSSVSIALGVVALLWAFVRAEYRALGTRGWWTGVGAVLLVVAAATTGELLPWSEQAVLATEVRTGLLGIAPGIGDRLKETVLGGDVIANPTLLRFHALHVAILPALLLGLVWMHVRGRRARAADPDRGLGIPAALFGLLVAAVIGYASWAMTAPEGDPSAPEDIRAWLPDGAPLGEVYVAGDDGYLAWPEWYVLWLNKLLKLFPSDYEIVPAIVIPTLLLLVLLLLPWLDRSRRHRFAHPAALWPGLLVFVGMVGLSVANHLDRPLDPDSDAGKAALAAQAEAGETTGDPVDEAVLASSGPLVQRPAPPPYSLSWNRLEREGYALVRRHDCMDCHEWQLDGHTYGKEEHGAPPLQEMLRDMPVDKYVEMIADPEEELGTEDMPPYDFVPEEQLRAIGHFLRRVGEG